MHRVLLATLISITLGGCAGLTDDGTHTIGTAEARITAVPPSVGCISITVTGGGRTVANDFDVAPGQPALLMMSKLPAGDDTFSAFAFDTRCADSAGAQPSWSSEPTAATIAAGHVTAVALRLKPTGGASVGIDFDGDGGTGGDGGIYDGGTGDGGGYDGGVYDLAPGPYDGGGPDLAPSPSDGGPVDLAGPHD